MFHFNVFLPSILLASLSLCCSGQVDENEYLEEYLKNRFGIFELFPPIKMDVVTDVVYIKCPNNKTIIDDHRKISYQLNSDVETYTAPELGYTLVAFSPPKNLDSQEFICGTIFYNDSRNNFIKLRGSIILKWINKYDHKVKDIPFDLSLKRTTDTVKMINGYEVFMTTKNKNGSIRRYQPLNDNDVSKNDYLYAFYFPDKDLTEGYIMADFVFKPKYDVFPNLVLPEKYKVISTPIFGSQYNVIIKNFTEESIELKLKEPGGTEKFKDFFDDYEIKTERLGFNKNFTLEKLNKIVTFGLIINISYIDIVNISVSKVYENGTKMEKNYVYIFSLPNNSDENFVSETKYITYKDSRRKAKCRLERIGFSTLEMVSFNNTTIKVSDLMNSKNKTIDKFQLTNNYVEYNEKFPKGLIECYYITYTKVRYQMPKFYVYLENYKETVINETSEEIELTEKDYQAYLKRIYKEREEKEATRQIKINVTKTESRKVNQHVKQFWNQIRSLSYVDICDLLENEQYFPMKPKVSVYFYEYKKKKCRTVRSQLVQTCSTVVSQFYEKNSISAHYISFPEQDRTYIISEMPTEDKVNNFWDMIVNEEVTTIITIVYQKTVYGFEKFYKFWPEKEYFISYGSVKVKLDMDSDVDPSKVKLLKLVIMKDKTLHNVKLHIIRDWRMGDVSNYQNQLINIYQNIVTDPESSTVLVTVNNDYDNRGFLLVYLAVSIEIYTNFQPTESIISPPNIMEIIKKIREQREGGSLIRIEFLCLLFAIIKYFVKYETINSDNYYEKFKSMYEQQLNEYQEKELYMDGSKRSYLRYIDNFDYKTVTFIEKFFYVAGNRDPEDLKILATKFYTVLEYQNNLMKKNPSKYYCIIDEKTIPVVNNNIVSISDNDEISSKEIFYNFVNANIFEYYLTNDFCKKIILCSTPYNDGFENMYKMIFKYKIEKIILLIDYSIFKKKEFTKYWPSRVGNGMKTCTFVIKKIKDIPSNNNEITIEVISIESTYDSNISHSFTIYNYKGWPSDGSIPKLKSFLDFYEIVNKKNKDSPIIVQGRRGLGKTGTYTLFSYLLDIIEAGLSFNFYDSLIKLRNIRYGAISTPKQYLMVLRALSLYFRDDIYKVYFKLSKRGYSLGTTYEYKIERDIKMPDIDSEVLNDDIVKEKIIEKGLSTSLKETQYSPKTLRARFRSYNCDEDFIDDYLRRMI
uniref:6-cysteine protein n=1 Tax=Parastrongyloides trichosuri TaxID=131310 RepID=A0A0N5A793_PARTI